MMNIYKVLFLSVLFLFQAAYTSAAEVKNAMSKQAGNRAEFIYDLVGEEAEAEVTVTITIRGKTYKASDLHLEGDLGKVTTGKKKKIYWNVPRDFPRGFSGKIAWEIVVGGKDFHYRPVATPALLADRFEKDGFEQRWRLSSNAPSYRCGWISEGIRLFVERPQADCQGVEMISRKRLNGFNLDISLELRKEGYGATWMQLGNPSKGAIAIHINTDDVPHVAVLMYMNGNLVHDKWVAPSSQFRNKTVIMKIRKRHSGYGLFIDEKQMGPTLENKNLGDRDLELHIGTHSCKWKSGSADDVFRKVEVLPAGGR